MELTCEKVREPEIAGEAVEIFEANTDMLLLIEGDIDKVKLFELV